MQLCSSLSILWHCLSYLIIREMQIKTTMRHQLTSFTMATIKRQKIMSFGENVEKLELLCTAGGKVKWYSYRGKHNGCSSKNLNRITVFPLLGMYLKELTSQSQRDLYTHFQRSTILHNSCNVEATQLFNSK